MTPIRKNFSYAFKDNWLRLVVAWNNIRLFFWTGIRIDRTPLKGKYKWTGSRCRQNTTHGPDNIKAEVINRHLDELEAKISDFFHEFERSDSVPSKEDLALFLSRKKNSPSVWEAFNEFVREGLAQKGWAPNTVKSVRNVEAFLRIFRPKLALTDINTPFLNSVIEKMGSQRVSQNSFKTGQKGYSNATIIKHARTIRWFVSWCVARGYISRSACRDFSPSIRKIPQPVIFLTWEELMRWEQAQWSPGSEEEAASDFFLFCCFTSLRFSDALALRKSAVHDDHIEVVTQKTDTPLVIELNSHSRRILEKYKQLPGDFALPRITNNRLNHLLKDLGDALGIDTPVTSAQYYGTERIDRTIPKWQLLSSHAARRTFICNALALGIPPHIVMKWTGHTEYASMRPYIDASSSARASSMALFDNPPTPR